MTRLSKRDLALLLILILLGASLRLYNLGGQGLWWDEMFTLLIASGEASDQLGPCFRRECEDKIIVMSVKDFRDFLSETPAVRFSVVRDVYRHEPSHPPLYYMVVNMFLALLGTSEFALRLPSALFGIMTIPFVFLLGKRFFSTEVGMVAASLFAFAPNEVYFAQEARMYSMVLFLTVISTWLLADISCRWKERRITGWTKWLCYIVAIIAGI